MAKKANITMERAEVDHVVRSTLPGWKLSAVIQRKRFSTVTDGVIMKRVGDLEQLRKKYLGTSNTLNAQDQTLPAHDTAKRRSRTVRVEPESGGPAKVADLVAGKVTIVQG